ncbi:MAG: hypothetical protein CMN76_15400 [Spirochaetaceae bacterium]|nr:hypothetical protein [Spirochaetaceae bacterium]|tara:strand:- start:122872 stop:123105 length:234 start_codon:yes stop_codon:yes gene_type:complete
MAQALTPSSPAEQIRALKAPVHFFIGEKDQLIDPHKLMVYYEELKPSTKADSSFTEIPGADHLSILGAGTTISRKID